MDVNNEEVVFPISTTIIPQEAFQGPDIFCIFV